MLCVHSSILLLVEEAPMDDPKRGSRPVNLRDGVSTARLNETVSIVGNSLCLPQAIDSRDKLFDIIR